MQRHTFGRHEDIIESTASIFILAFFFLYCPFSIVCLLSAYYVLCSSFASVCAGNCPRRVFVWRGDT